MRPQLGLKIAVSYSIQSSLVWNLWNGSDALRLFGYKMARSVCYAIVAKVMYRGFIPQHVIKRHQHDRYRSQVTESRFYIHSIITILATIHVLKEVVYFTGLCVSECVENHRLHHKGLRERHAECEATFNRVYLPTSVCVRSFSCMETIVAPITDCHQLVYSNSYINDNLLASTDNLPGTGTPHMQCNTQCPLLFVLTCVLMYTMWLQRPARVNFSL